MNNSVCSICIVDDHTSYRKGLKLLLELFPNYKVLFIAANGKDFIDQLKQHTIPDIVLLDINMPEMDGYATANWIRKNHPEIKILTLSSMDDELNILRMIQNGANGYLLKDADTDEIEKALLEVQTEGYYYADDIKKIVLKNTPNLGNPHSEVNLINSLTPLEIELLDIFCSDYNYTEIAKMMHKSFQSIDKHRELLFAKFGVSSRVGLVVQAIKKGIIKP